MKKIILRFVLIVLFSFSFVSFSSAEDLSDTGWVIKEFNSEIVISKNQNVHVREKITVDFKNLIKHGIYRYIPYKYSRSGNNYNVKIIIDSITNSIGNDIPYSRSISGGDVYLKIGDPNNTISGEQIYIINYELQRVVGSFSDHDELYWNVTGNGWPVPIEKTNVSVIWPENAVVKDNICFVGVFGSRDQNCTVEKSTKNIIFASSRQLEANENMTIASGVLPGVIIKYTFWQKLLWFLADNWPYLIPIVVLFYLIRNYYINGKDPRGRETIVPEFAPPDKLRPAVMGTIQDEKVDMNDISAVIIDFAVRGYIKIKEIENKGLFGIKSNDFEFSAIGKSTNDLAVYEKEIYSGIFGGSSVKKLSDLKEKFYTHIGPIKKDLYKQVTDLGYFSKNPNTTRNIYFASGGFTASLGLFAGPVLGAITGSVTSFMVAFIVSGISIIIFAAFMPKRTDKGVETTRQIKGFKLYMNTAEKYRQQFNEKEKIFERYLPYAMVFGIVGEWANKFKDMQIERPDWYQGHGVFYPIIFANSLSNMQSSVNSTMISAPSSAGSGGSGFSGGGSGGGFGGGGGGSW